MLDAVAGMVREQLDEQDEVGLINFYSENTTQFHELTSTIASLSQDLPLVSTRKCYLDVDAANAQISSLQGLHLLIAGLANESPPYPSDKHNKKTPAKHPPSTSQHPPSTSRHPLSNGTSPTSKTPARPASQNRPRVTASPTNRSQSSTSSRK
jgi:hypothetical protein